ncbi:transcriptional regulatory protein [Tolypocladium capitatum]|uniref:Transcriptional regulatory protein n=1 Tax=Tolypocladium capitatum TaxID=45235 RepID=A0A2K3QQB7_9HYPO|nr:transcriptional regulatory protein [Tolypocladium capitatum]
MASMSPIDTAAAISASSSNGGSVSPRQAATPKNVAFELMFSNSPQYRARLPMRVQIYPHDTTDSIVTTVKNFYGLYSGPTGSKGVSFEDDHGNTLIARYENFSNNMVVYVRVIEGSPSAFAPHPFHPATIGSESYYAGEGYQAPQPQRFEQDMPRPSSRASRRRSPSPNAIRGRRSDSSSTASKKGRSRSVKDRRSMPHSQTDAYSDSMNGYSSGDGAPSSTSGKNKEQLGNTDISVENIVEGGRRKRAKFESSELPLFAPPQMPAATSNPSVSPARRIEHHRPSLPFVHPGQNPFTNSRPMQTPQTYNNGFAHSNLYATPASNSHRSRGSIGYASNASGVATGLGVLPTPDPTVGSCMSEEDKDVAIQLMRLGESSNISHGRTSASTMDDTFSGRADAASSTGATSDGESESESEDELPAARRQKLDVSGGSKRIYQTTEAHFIPTTESADVSGDDADFEDGANNSVAMVKAGATKKQSSVKPKPASSILKPAAQKPSKASRPSSIKTKKLPAAATGPMSPASITHSRKQSVASTGHVPLPGEDDQPDLSTKPRCQRCRKSKKGCDRQRPCGRCRDAGLSADQCISEDEGNGRKGRYGRHMGVPIKKGEAPVSLQPALLPAALITTTAITTADKAKKRKR